MLLSPRATAFSMSLLIMLSGAAAVTALSGASADAGQTKVHGKGLGAGKPSPTSSPTASPTPEATSTPTSATASPSATTTTTTTTTSASAVYSVPASIDATGATDVTAQLSAVIAGVPDYSVLALPSNATYRVDNTLEIVDRFGLTIDGNGSTLTTSKSQDGNRAQLRIVGGGAITITHLTIRGASTVGGTSSAFVDSLQWQHGLDLRGVNGADISDVTVTDVYGDCFYVGMGYGASAGKWSKDIHVHNSRCARNGRQGVAVTAGNRVTVDHSSFSAISLMTFNIEPNGDGWGAKSVYFTDNAVGTGPRQQLLGIVGAGPVDDVVLSRNQLSGKSLTVLIRTPDGTRRSNIVISDNVSDTPLWITNGSAVVAGDVNGLTVTGNYQALEGPGMVFASVTNSCQIDISGNSYPGGVAESSVQATTCP